MYFISYESFKFIANKLISFHRLICQILNSQFFRSFLELNLARILVRFIGWDDLKAFSSSARAKKSVLILAGDNWIVCALSSLDRSSKVMDDNVVDTIHTFPYWWDNSSLLCYNFARLSLNRIPSIYHLLIPPFYSQPCKGYVHDRICIQRLLVCYPNYSWREPELIWT